MQALSEEVKYNVHELTMKTFFVIPKYLIFIIFAIQASKLTKWNDCHFIRNEIVTHTVVVGVLLSISL